MEFLISIAEKLLKLILGDLFYKNKIYREKANEFKETLIKDLPSYESNETTLGATIIQLFPAHNAAFRKLLLYIPQRKQNKYISQWAEYENIHSMFSSLGVFGAVAAILPAEDFRNDPKYINELERKNKLKITNVFNYLLKKL